MQLTALFPGDTPSLGLVMSEQLNATTGQPQIVVDGWKESALLIVKTRMTTSTSATKSKSPPTAVGTEGQSGIVTTSTTMRRERWPVSSVDAIRVGDVLIGLDGHDIRGAGAERVQALLHQLQQVPRAEPQGPGPGPGAKAEAALPAVRVLLARAGGLPVTPASAAFADV